LFACPRLLHELPRFSRGGWKIVVDPLSLCRLWGAVFFFPGPSLPFFSVTFNDHFSERTFGPHGLSPFVDVFFSPLFPPVVLFTFLFSLFFRFSIRVFVLNLSRSTGRSDFFFPFLLFLFFALCQLFFFTVCLTFVFLAGKFSVEIFKWVPTFLFLSPLNGPKTRPALFCPSPPHPSPKPPPPNNLNPHPRGTHNPWQKTFLWAPAWPRPEFCVPVPKKSAGPFILWGLRFLLFPLNTKSTINVVGQECRFGLYRALFCWVVLVFVFWFSTPLQPKTPL